MMARPSEEMISSAFKDAISSRPFRFHRQEARFYVDEFDGLNGRADFIISPTRLESMSQEKICGFIKGVFSFSSAQIVSALFHEGHSEESLMKKMGLSRKTILMCLRSLESSGIVEKGDDDEYRICPSFALPSLELWAIELKVDNWKHALYQSLQYQSFSHCAIVVIPMVYANRISSHAERFRAFNVGVIAIDTESGTMRTIVKAKRGKPSSTPQYLYAISVFLKRLHPDLCFQGK